MQKEPGKNTSQPIPVYEAEIVDESDEQSEAVVKIKKNTNVGVSQKIATAASFLVAALEVFKKIKNVFGDQNSDRRTGSKKNGKRVRRRKKGGE